MDKILREKELLLLLREKARVSEVGKLVIELVALRLAKYKDELVKEENAVTRGKAQEMRDLHKILTEIGGN